MADGIVWLRMPLPFSLNHINLWLLRDDSEAGSSSTQVSILRTSRAVWQHTFAAAMRNDPASARGRDAPASRIMPAAPAGSCSNSMSICG